MNTKRKGQNVTFVTPFYNFSRNDMVILHKKRPSFCTLGCEKGVDEGFLMW